MKDALNIFKQDLKNIKRVPLVGILLIGLAILPALYAWFNLSASWDPYSNTQGVQVAVVNNDDGYTVDGEDINIGDDLEENLKDNNDFGWSFVSRSAAEDGVETGEYYASIYIEETFSEEISSVIGGEPKSAEMHYQVNEKINAIAPKMTSSGASAIVTEINDTFIEETTQSLFHEFDEAGIKLEEEMPTFRRIRDTVYSLEEEFPQINETADTIIQIDENWDNIDSYADKFLEIQELEDEISEGEELILLLEERLPDAHRLGDSVVELEEQLPAFESAVDQMEEIDSAFEEITAQLEEALNGAQEAQEVIETALAAVPEVEEKTVNVEEYLNAFLLFSEQAETAALSVTETFSQQLLFAGQTAQSIDESLSQLNDEKTAEAAQDRLNEAESQLASHINTLDQAISTYEALYEVTEDEEIQGIINSLTELKNETERLHDQVVSINSQLDEGDIPGEEEVQNIQNAAGEVQEKSDNLHSFMTIEGTETVKSAFSKLEDELDAAGESLDSQYERLEELEEVLINAVELSVTGEEQIQEQLNELPEIEQKVQETVERINDAYPELERTVKNSADFVRQDLPEVDRTIASAADFVRDDLPGLQEDYQELANLIEEEMPNVESSVSELATFSQQELPELEEDVDSAADRIREIEDEDVLNELVSILRNDLEDEQEFFSNPVNLEEETLFPVPNYGSANTPFYTTLSLWVGALLLTNLMSTNLHRKDMSPSYSLRSIYMGRMLLFLIVGFLQGLIVSLGNLFMLGVYAAHPVMFVLFSIFIGLIFMTMVYALASILGNIGKALAIVLLVLQLSGGGGTFPIEVAPSYFQQINPYLPFTYAINLLREAVGGIIPALMTKNLVILTGFWLFTFAVGFFLKPVLAARIEKTYEKSKSSRLIE
ncbi:YhgE/Pip domain-containing protein [Halalkalibacillus halophilus]|uniref:YhgE/Pip domain-containing protein n=1 Tax=Halalkalibacillus halophilus TaxID=392827 RepID=UPI000427C4B9|nr:YhgE/Pip domain-containing protein [Halalkalibacillus halophilus]